MFNANAELLNFYNDKVKLFPVQQAEMRDRRNSNRRRLDSGLANNGSPQNVDNLIQGSYKMKTMIQRLNNDYDIDDGIIFTREALKGPNGGDKSALDARKMVLEALERDSSKFKEPPKSLKNCVRVFYSEGYHIDVPVYRKYDENGEPHLELASSDWKESDPTQIADWFASEVQRKSHPSDNTQLRRIVCLLKKWANSRVSWKLPNGLIFSVYAADHYSSNTRRDDEEFVMTLEAIQARLMWNKSVPNPVNPNEDFASGRETKIDNLKQKLDEHLPNLTAVLRNSSCTKNEAMRAWASFFNDDFFRDYIDEDGGSVSSAGGGLLISGTPEEAVQKQGQGRYA
jgi:hypothetical protein